MPFDDEGWSEHKVADGSEVGYGDIGVEAGNDCCDDGDLGAGAADDEANVGNVIDYGHGLLA